MPRPDVIVARSGPREPNSGPEAADAVLVVEIMAPGSGVHDRLVKPSLYRDAGIPSWRVEHSGRHLALFEFPLRGDYQTQLGQVILKVADVDVPIDLDAIARDAFGE